MKKLILFSTILLFIILSGGVVYAQKKASPAAEARQRVQQRIEELREKKETKASEIKDNSQELREKLRSRRGHVFGTITSISGTTINIETKKETVKTIFTDNVTKFVQVGQGGKKTIALSDLKVGDKISAVGIAKDENSGLARFVVKFNRSILRRHAVFGTVKSISKDALTLTHLIYTDKIFTVKTTTDTKIKIKDIENASLSDIKVGDRVAASGTIDNKGVITAKRIFVIPGNFAGVKEKESTSSATTSATP